MQLANGIIDRDEDGWVGATPERPMPEAEEPAAVLTEARFN